jgi:chorismate mutase
VSDTRLGELRSQIEALDRELVSLIGQRRDLAIEIGRTKQALGLPVMDPQQEAKVVRRAAEIARELGVDEELTRDVIWRIIAAARAVQEGHTTWGPPRDAG